MGRTRNNICFGTAAGSFGQTMPYVFIFISFFLTLTAASGEPAPLPQPRRGCDKTKTPEWRPPMIGRRDQIDRTSHPKQDGANSADTTGKEPHRLRQPHPAPP